MTKSMAYAYLSAVSWWTGCARSRRIMSDTVVRASMRYPKISQTQVNASLSKKVMPGMLGWFASVLYLDAATYSLTRSARISGPSSAVSRSAPRIAHKARVKVRSTTRRHRWSHGPPTPRGQRGPRGPSIPRGLPTPGTAGTCDAGRPPLSNPSRAPHVNAPHASALLLSGKAVVRGPRGPTSGGDRGGTYKRRRCPLA